MKKRFTEEELEFDGSDDDELLHTVSQVLILFLLGLVLLLILIHQRIRKWYVSSMVYSAGNWWCEDGEGEDEEEEEEEKGG